MCINTKLIYKSGYYKEDTFSHKKGEFYDVEAFVGCSHCEKCDSLKANNWLIRNYYESLQHKEICFLTLTYEKNPIVLVKKDLQDFIKRLRITIERKIDKNIKIRYFGCGEYGTKGRPHFHLILYGFIPNDLTYLEINKKANILYDSEFIKNIWANGRIAIELFNNNQILYTSLYNTKSEIQKKKYYVLREKLKCYEKAYDEMNKIKVYSRRDDRLRKTLVKNITETIEQIDDEKKWIKKTNEFLIYSKGLGFESFYKNYNENYFFKEYIDDKEFFTPTSWVKKLANKKFSLNAVNELKRRADFQINITEESKKYVDLLNIKVNDERNFIKNKQVETNILE